MWIGKLLTLSLYVSLPWQTSILPAIHDAAKVANASRLEKLVFSLPTHAKNSAAVRFRNIISRTFIQNLAGSYTFSIEVRRA